MDDLVRWLTAQLDTDAARATAAADGDSGEWFMGDKWNVYRAEDETPGEDVESNTLVVYGNVKPQSEHIAEHDPARVLREIDAKRQVLALHSPSEFGTWVGDDDDQMPACGTCGTLTARFPCKTLRLLASMYSHRPGYAEAIASAG